MSPAPRNRPTLLVDVVALGGAVPRSGTRAALGSTLAGARELAEKTG
jgi:hypothetical protein